MKTSSKSFKVVCIKDSSQEALRVNSVSYLKSYTAGDIDEDDVYFTMLLQTNNPIYSDKAGNVEKALRNRLLVVPFEYDFSSGKNDNSLDEEEDDVAEVYKNNYFDREKQGIVRKALEALHGVMKNDCVINFCVIAETNRATTPSGNPKTQKKSDTVVLRTAVIVALL